MLIYFISKNYADQLCDTCQKQICVERFLVLGFASGKPETTFKMVDGAFYSGSDLIGILPFGSPTQSAGISSQVFFQIDIDHSPTWRRRTGIFTMAYASIFSGGGVFLPFYFRTTELITDDPIPAFAGTVRLHGKGRVIRTAWNPILIYGIIFVFRFSVVVQWDIGLLKMNAVTICINTKGITGKKFPVKFGRIKSCIA